MHALIAAQLAAALVLVGVLMLWLGSSAAYSALVGTAIAIVPNCYLSARLLRRKPSATPHESLRGIYMGELLKIAFTTALFVIAIRLLDVGFLIVVASYLAMIVVNWVALLFIDVGEQARAPGAGTSSPC